MRILFLFALFFLSSCQPKNQVDLSGKSVSSTRTMPSPPGETALISKEAFQKRKHSIICLDAGHGGYDTGTRRKKAPLLSEKYVALDLVFALRQALLPMGYQVILTRDDDRFISLPDRVLFARKKKSTLFVSLHFNWAKNTVCRGVEVFYFEKKNDLRSSLSKQAAELCLQSILSDTPLPSRGVKHGNFYVVRETPMPAVLIESGFFSNSEDVLFLKQKSNRTKLAFAIAKAIDQFCKR